MDNPSKINPFRSDIFHLRLPARIHRPGQELIATVVDGPKKADTTANVLIRVGNQTLQVRSMMALQMGDVLKLQVSRIQPQILLSIVAINGIKPSQSTDPLKSAMLQLQPRQGGLPELLGTVKALTAELPSGGLMAQLAPNLRQLLNVLVARHEITETGVLGQAFLNSGLFLEKKLLSGNQGVLKDRDLKAALLSLLRVLHGQKEAVSKHPRWNSCNTAQPPHRAAQPEPQPRIQPGDLGTYSDKQIQALLRELTEAALSRLSLHQIASAENAREGKLRWLTEIPLYDGEHADVLHLCIARDAPGTTKGRLDRWSVELALDLPTLGPIRARVSLYKGQISSTLWAENPSTAEKLNKELSQLRDTLEAHNLKVRSLACYAGKPNSTERDDPLPALLDTQA